MHENKLNIPNLNEKMQIRVSEKNWIEFEKAKICLLGFHSKQQMLMLIGKTKKESNAE